MVLLLVAWARLGLKQETKSLGATSSPKTLKLAQPVPLMIPRRIAMATACDRSDAPSLERMLFM